MLRKGVGIFHTIFRLSLTRYASGPNWQPQKQNISAAHYNLTFAHINLEEPIKFGPVTFDAVSGALSVYQLMSFA